MKGRILNATKCAELDAEKALNPLLEQATIIDHVDLLDKLYASIDLVMSSIGEKKITIFDILRAAAQLTTDPDTVTELCNHVIMFRSDATEDEIAQAQEIKKKTYNKQFN